MSCPVVECTYYTSAEGCLNLNDAKIPPFGKGGERGDFLGEPGSEIPPAPLS